MQADGGATFTIRCWEPSMQATVSVVLQLTKQAAAAQQAQSQSGAPRSMQDMQISALEREQFGAVR